ncbi:alpha/beta fold hydrolase [Paucibacter sp. PLA-PC-4]|uniref:alpha/beta hydrolase n=1 Tax=Paucibacter sp. PLA-PC-4 TaxID=2993655 RepID=UPI00224AD2EB|nr:alpha/beta hydrolase [Paucibacter sp. PLA-PC-4]MCX2864924.1 alpha/beta fold hydrolase [Paucibacter sp. PLA-PC-4]
MSIASPADSASRQTLVFHCQAYPALALDGRPVQLRLKHGLALLLLLSEAPRQLARGQLAEMLWASAPGDVGRARLRRLIHEINAILGLTLVLGDADTLWLDHAAVDIDSDVVQVRRAARQLLASPDASESRQSLETLLAPTAHQIADGFELNSDLFNAWLDARRLEHESLVIRALGNAAGPLVASGQPGLAAEAAVRLISLEPLGDTGHALLLEARAMLGDASGVESAYFSCAELMRTELGVRPSARIEAAYAAAQARLKASTDQEAPRPNRLPPIRFADADDGAVAYLELGSAQTTVIILFGLWSHVEVAWEEPSIRAILQRLARRWRVVLMDRRGTGLSERVGVQLSARTGADDVEAVRRAIGAERVWLMGNSVGGTIAIEHAHRYPDHVQGLLLYGAGSRGTWAEDYPWALTYQQLELWLDELRTSWGQATSWQQFAPSMASDPVAQDWWARMLRQSMSRNSVPLVLQAFAQMDVRDRLPHLRTPTLIVQREGDRVVRAGAARHLAASIPGAELVMLNGNDHLMWCGDTAAVLDQMEQFVASRTS